MLSFWWHRCLHQGSKWQKFHQSDFCFTLGFGQALLSYWHSTSKKTCKKFRILWFDAGKVVPVWWPLGDMFYFFMKQTDRHQPETHFSNGFSPFFKSYRKFVSLYSIAGCQVATIQQKVNESETKFPSNFEFRMCAGIMTSSNGNLFRVTESLRGEPPVTGGFPSQRPVTRSFDVFFGLRLYKRLSKQSRRRWCETPSRSGIMTSL